MVTFVSLLELLWTSTVGVDELREVCPLAQYLRGSNSFHRIWRFGTHVAKSFAAY
jgi:hypothetical protein